jgi:hypothetical protein
MFSYLCCAIAVVTHSLLFLNFIFENFRCIRKLLIDRKTMNLNFIGCLGKCKCIRMGPVQVRFKLSVKVIVYNLLASEVTDIEVQEFGGKY